MDFKSYPEWNPFIVSAEGEPTVGARLKIDIQPPGGKKMTFKPKVITADRGKEFTWLGRLLFPGLFDGEHSFKFEELPGMIKALWRFSRQTCDVLCCVQTSVPCSCWFEPSCSLPAVRTGWSTRYGPSQCSLCIKRSLRRNKYLSVWRSCGGVAWRASGGLTQLCLNRKCRVAAGGRTKMIHGEVFKGILVGMVLNPEVIEKGFKGLNVALKQRVENK